MTESEWLTSDDGERMWDAVVDRLSSRKHAILIGDIDGSAEHFQNEVLTRYGLEVLEPEALHHAHLLREQLGNPFRPYPFDPRWRTETVVALATGIEAERAFDRMPILADALEDAGCDERPMLDHLRGPGPHAVGCWVLDLILDHEPELFALPPLVPTPRRMRLGPFTPPPEGMA